MNKIKNIFKGRKIKLAVLILIVIVVSGAVFWVVTASSSYVSDTFTDETKIAKGTQKVNIDTSGGQVKLQDCYTADPSWTKIDDTNVRDIEGAYNETVAKDIYCDDTNCILYTDEVVPPGSVCVATDSDVYANILWHKTDISGTKVWGNSGNLLTGNDVGGTHGTLSVGNDPDVVTGKNWLERYYDSTAGTYTAMDECKALGSGWRLPNILELDSIRDQAKGSAPYTYLPNIVSSNYWSSTECSSTYACCLHFTTGSVGTSSKTSSIYVRCVRGQ